MVIHNRFDVSEAQRLSDVTAAALTAVWLSSVRNVDNNALGFVLDVPANWLKS
jgi:hypothetical protein